MSDDELLDLVDEHDVVIGEVRRGETEKDPALIHREIAILLSNSEGRVLLQQRSPAKAVRPGYWTISCAGHVLKGVTPLAAAHAELQEELGFDAPLRFVRKFLDRRLPNHSRFLYVFLGSYGGQPIVLQEDEVTQAKLFTKDEYRELAQSAPITPGSVKIIEDFWAGKLLNKGVRALD